MIKYKLLCKECDLKFDSWFASSNEYERLKKKKLLNCHNCNSVKVEKTIMSPRLISHKLKTNEKINLEKYNKVKKTIKEYQRFIKDSPIIASILTLGVWLIQIIVWNIGYKFYYQI